ncbi:hypothetical protein [Nonomuraea lactucae]|uniref:hypothetical protein n=1 Tax=Nonomuraea lactucae TaxID=2249762 RepID=UPI000DE329E1|nr:hypothetical protein [Nonomuraea lactucae]
MKKIAVGIVSALVGGALLVSGGAATAQTRTPTVEIKDISPNPVVVKAGSEAEAYFKVQASSDVDSVRLSVEPQAQFRALRAKDARQLENWRFAIPFNENDPEGKWKATAQGIKNGRVVVTDTAFFSVEVEEGGKGETRISRFSADPFKVRKGKTVWFSGRLQTDDDGWEGVRGERVSIYYRSNGSNGWKWVASADTRWGGKFVAKTRAWKSGTYKAVYAGSDELEGAESRTDYVRVYRGWYHR